MSGQTTDHSPMKLVKDGRYKMNRLFTNLQEYLCEKQKKKRKISEIVDKSKNF